MVRQQLLLCSSSSITITSLPFSLYGPFRSQNFHISSQSKVHQFHRTTSHRHYVRHRTNLSLHQGRCAQNGAEGVQHPQRQRPLRLCRRCHPSKPTQTPLPPSTPTLDSTQLTWATIQSVVDKADKSKSDIIAERQANLPLPDQPPTASDWNSSDASTVNVGSGRDVDAAFSKGQGGAREGKDGLSGIPNDAVTREAKGKAGLADTTN